MNVNLACVLILNIEVCITRPICGFQNGPVQATEAEAHRILDRFAECGGNFIDTSDTYQQGRTEEILGRWLAK